MEDYSLIELQKGMAAGRWSSSIAAAAGHPNITVPAGFVKGLPVGISLFAGAFHEPTLIRIACSFEHATRVRTPPMFTASFS